MMIGSIMISILGAAVYDGVKEISKELTGIKDDEIIDKIYECIENSMIKFKNEYSEKYKKGNDSFLAREENLKLMIQLFHYSSSIDLIKQLNKKGFVENMDATEEEIISFVNILNQEINEYFVLDKIITEKKNANVINDKLDNIGSDIKRITRKNNEEIKNEMYLVKEDGTKISCENKIKSKYKLGEDTIVETLMKNKTCHVDVTNRNGDNSYYEIDNQNGLTSSTIDLSKYKLDFIEEDILNEKIMNLNNGMYIKETKLKWGNKMKATYNKNDELCKIEGEGYWRFDKTTKTIKQQKQ